MTSKTNLSVEPYKGTRDFYPKDQFIQNYIFSVWRKVCESYGYLEYDASILEETALYRAKSGEEIVGEQTYSFTDRGGRDVTIRPEMTPTVARMVAQKRKELTFPLRWFSMPNLFRYERPQRGRLREHWQLNADIFGVDNIEADIEVISLAYDIMKGFGAKTQDFEIRVNNRRLLSYIIDKHFKLSPEQSHKVFKLMDKFRKMPREDFDKAMSEIAGEKGKSIMEFLFVQTQDQMWGALGESEEGKETFNLVEGLKKRGIKNFIFDFSIVRGFDYYTGPVFEVFDKDPKNNRSLFGGGRYDDLVSIFGVEKVSGMGFGMGDVTIRDFLETHNLLPEYCPPVKLYICHLEGFLEQANELVAYIREQGVNASVDLTNRKVSQQVKTADKESIPFVLVVGEDEVKSGKYKVKSLKDNTETEVEKDKLSEYLK